MSKQNSLSTSFPVPIGAVMPFAAVISAPAGFLVCDGSEYSETDYPELARVLGTTWNNAPAPGHFNVPNLVNSYLRGVAVNTGTTVPANIEGTLSFTLVEDNLPDNLPLTTNANFKLNAQTNRAVILHPLNTSIDVYTGSSEAGTAAKHTSDFFQGGTTTITNMSFANTTNTNTPVTYDLSTHFSNNDLRLKGYDMMYIIKAV
jgi:microcystin-dependent protein